MDSLRLGLPYIFIESERNFVFIPILFNILDAIFNLGLSFLLSSEIFLKYEIPFAFEATKKIIKNSSIALEFKADGQFIDFKEDAWCYPMVEEFFFTFNEYISY